MDKFYLAKLTDLLEETNKSKLELVEIQFSRKPPTFGLMYLTAATLTRKHSNDSNHNNNTTNRSTSKLTSNKTTQVVVNLSVMQINDDNVANFKPLKHVDLSMLPDCKDAVHKTIVDFDTSKSVLLDEEGDDQHIVSQTSNQQSINCVILTDDGSIFGVNLRLLPYLNDERAINSAAFMVRLTTSDTTERKNNITIKRQHRLSSCVGSYIQCKFQPSTNDSSIFIHLLAEKYYCLYELTPFSNNKLKLINEYWMPSNVESFSRFKKVNIVKTNPQIVLLELNNSSLKVINQSKCLFSQNLNELFDLKCNSLSHLIISSHSDKTNNECVLLSFAGTKIVAQNLQITNHEEISSLSSNLNYSSSISQLDKDPDKLLPKTPSFELDTCWSIDLNDIESLNNSAGEPDEEDVSSNNDPFRLENDKIKYGCLMPLWSADSLLSTSEESQRWPEYLIVTYKYHILIYSFEQQTVLPFSVVYDSSFLKLTTLDDRLIQTNSSEQQQHLLAKNNNETKYVDIKTKPKLLHSFKLIGSHTADVLFNNILLSYNNNNNLIECTFFPLLNLIISITNNGDMFALKLNSSLAKLEVQKDNLFQQQYAKAICGDSLLKNQMNRLKKEINSLKNNIEHLEGKSLSMVGQRKSHENNNLSSLIQTDLRQSDETEFLYYLSMCLSNLIKVSQIIIMSAVNSYILNPVSTTNCQTIHIENNIDASSDKNETRLKISNNFLQKQHDSIQSWAILDLEKEDPVMSRVVKLNVPLFITDKQQGSIKVFYVLDNCPRKRSNESFYHPLIRSHLIGGVENSILESFDQSNTMFHIEELQIKPLMSYLQVPFKNESLFVNTEKILTKLTITGLYKRESMISWLAECFQDSIDLRKNKVELESQSNHLSIEFNITDPNNQLSISSDDVIAIDIIKKHILKRATDESTKLTVTQSPSSSTVVSNQNQTSESRVKLMGLVKTALPNVDNSNEKLESLDIILDSLMSEISNINRGLSIDLNRCFEDEVALENSLRKDLEKIDRQ